MSALNNKTYIYIKDVLMFSYYDHLHALYSSNVGRTLGNDLDRGCFFGTQQAAKPRELSSDSADLVQHSNNNWP